MTRTSHPRPSAAWTAVADAPLKVQHGADQAYVTIQTDVRAQGDPYLEAHFPRLTVLPGVFVIDAVQRAVDAVTSERGGSWARLVELASIRLTAPVRGGDRTQIHVVVGAPGRNERVDVAATCRAADGTETATMRALFEAMP